MGRWGSLRVGAVSAAVIFAASCGGETTAGVPEHDAAVTETSTEGGVADDCRSTPPDASEPTTVPSPWVVTKDLARLAHIGRDRAGNVYVGGQRGDDLHPYLVKLSPFGEVVWEKDIASYGAYFTDMSVGDDGSVLAVGIAGGELGFQVEGAGIGPAAGFAVRFHGDGRLAAIVQLPRSDFLARAEPHAAALLSDGGFVIVGRVAWETDFGGGPLKARPVGTFFARYDACGRHVSSRLLSETSTRPVFDMVIDGSGRVLVAGLFEGVDLGGGAVTGGPLTLLQLDVDGRYVNGRAFPSSGAGIMGMAVDHSGDIVLAGWFGPDVDFGGGPLSSQGDADAFVAKLDPTLGYRWARALGGPGRQEAKGVAVDEAGSPIVVGLLRGGSMNAGGTILTPPAQGSAMFVARLDPTGNVLSALGATGTQYSESNAMGVVATRTTDVIVAGGYQAEFHLGPVSMPDPTGAKGGGLVLRIAP